MQGIRYNRKTTPKVKGGKVQKKDRPQRTAWRGFVVDRKTPAKGFRHVVTKRNIFEFIELLPNWRELVHGLERIILSAGDEQGDGFYIHYHRDGTGAIELCAWDGDLAQYITKDYFESHLSIFTKIELKYEIGEDDVTCWFDEAKAKAFLLIHVFMHELGHHHDRMRSKNGTASKGGEFYAENFATQYEDILWPLYIKKFGKP